MHARRSASASRHVWPSFTPYRPSTTTRSRTVEAHSPPSTLPTIVGYGSPRTVISGSVSAALRAVSSASSARSSVYRLSSADTPSRRTEACAARPGTVSRNVSAPAWAITTSRPVGSVITAASPTIPARIAASIPWPPSSSDGTETASTSPSNRSAAPDAATARSAARIATTPPFMSQAPRP